MKEEDEAEKIENYLGMLFSQEKHIEKCPFRYSLRFSPMLCLDSGGVEGGDVIAVM